MESESETEATATPIAATATPIAEITAGEVVQAPVISSPFPISLDVIGVDKGDNGQSCDSHIVCGHFVKQDNILVTKWAVQDFGDGTEQCYQVWKVAMDGLTQCHIGYLPRRVFVKKPDRYYDSVVLQVVEDLRISENRTERARSNRNYGMLFCKVVTNNPHYCGRNIFQGEAFDMSEIVVDKPIDESFEAAVPRSDGESSDSDDALTSASSVANGGNVAEEVTNQKNKKRKSMNSKSRKKSNK